MSQFFLNIIFFFLIPFIIWRSSNRIIPLAILPILIGVMLSMIGYHFDMGKIIMPSETLNLLGWLGILLLIFSAGLESVIMPFIAQKDGSNCELSNYRLLFTAAIAVTLPFFIGTAIAYWFLLPLEEWQPKQKDDVLNAAAIGLCIAVSALPVLVGIIRELPKKYRLLSSYAVRIAVIDDVVLWLGLTGLLLLSQDDYSTAIWKWTDFTAIIVLTILFFSSHYSKKHHWTISNATAWLIAALTLALGAWCTSMIGLHPFLGAYFAGIILPKTIVEKLYPEKLGFLALVFLAPFFFGQRGLSVDGSVFNWTLLGIAFGLVAVSAATKILAISICPPVKKFSHTETFALGSLLQCKGLMEIVVATILQNKGLLSETAYAVLVTLAILSTLITKPFFHWITKTAPSESEPIAGLSSKEPLQQ